jgi:hypothetical protein
MSQDMQFALPATGLQGCLFSGDRPAFDATFGGVERRWLDDASWIDYAPNWLQGADDLLAELVTALPWRQREVVMFDRLLPEPRLTCWWSELGDSDEPLPVLGEARVVEDHGVSQRRQGGLDPGHPGNREDVRFNAFAIARYDTDARAYSWRAYTAGHCGEVPLYVGAETYRWEYEPMPNVLVRFEATVSDGRWHQTGHTRVGDKWTQTFEMNLAELAWDS